MFFFVLTLFLMLTQGSRLILNSKCLNQLSFGCFGLIGGLLVTAVKAASLICFLVSPFAIKINDSSYTLPILPSAEQQP